MFNFSDRCYRGGKKHRFEARHTQQSIRAGDDMSTLWQAMNPKDRPNIYCGDVCVWCGAVVNAPGKKA